MTESPREMPEQRRANPVAVVVIGALLVWLVAANFKELVWYNIFPKRFAEVVPGEIYRSGKLTPAALNQVVREHGIRTIVDLGAWPEGSAGDTRQARTAAALGVERVRLPELEGDATGEVAHYVDALQLITDPARQPVLLHCGAGTERTGCVVALYRMQEERWSFEDAYREADEAGHSPRRNPHLREVLEAHGPEILAEFERERAAGARPGG